MTEVHEYNFGFVLSQYDYREIPDATLERVLNIIINTTMEENLRMGGGYHKYFWLDAVESWVGRFLLDCWKRILHLLRKDGKRKGCVVIVDEEGWTKMYAVKPEVGT